ncbi:histidinol-phosphate aminotransferase [Hydrogenispora ethanolica]|uniref:Histidinol-phosphate aminotransferase n=1 Tax=Hydrogenispora ethanolica TaxID=1082276 RepID=A0A4R1RQ74_HYDET|nr:histidinol-phosphate transaminase [Hydrogenispora ethanolica]TCL68535.1 histidinol-phosphate aminotransferase [Hydrogenispora ethanolica]
MKRSGMFRECIDRIPPYVPGKPIEEVERELGLNGVIKMASNENPLGPSQEVRQAVIYALDRVAQYPDANNFYLRDALVAELKVDPGQLLIGNGLDDVNRILAEALFNPDDEVIIPQPTFSQYEIVTRLMGAKPVFVKGDGYRHDLDAMLAAITDRTKMIFICNPNNPTGTIITETELVRFLRRVPASVLVVVDEAYAEFADDPALPNGIRLLQEGFANLVVYHTFSKIHGMAGLRLGYAVAAPELIRETLRIKDPFNVNLIAQAAGVAALNSKIHMKLSKELVQSGKRQFYEELDRLGIGYLPTQANFILIDCGQDSRAIYDFLLHNGIIVRATHSFGLPHCIRVTFGTAEQNDRFFRAFREGMKRLEITA